MSMSGHGPQAAILSMSPVVNASEIAQLIELAQNHIISVVRKKRRVKTVDSKSLAAAWNEHVVSVYNSDPESFHLTSLSLKSPAHIQDYFQRTDEALDAHASLLGVRGKLIDLRRLLRDVTSLAAAPLAPPPSMSSKPSSCCADQDPGEEGMKRKKAPRSCLECRTSGRGSYPTWQEGTKKNMKHHCTNKGNCVHYKEKKMPVQSEKRAKRTCKTCSSTGLGGFYLNQVGCFKVAHDDPQRGRFVCENPECAAMTGIPGGAVSSKDEAAEAEGSKRQRKSKRREGNDARNGNP